MDRPAFLQLSANAALKEKHLSALIAGRDPDHSLLAEAVREAQAAGSLELSGLPPTAEAVGRLSSAHQAVDPRESFNVRALLIWHTAAVGNGRFRAAERGRPAGPAPAPPALIAGRVAMLDQWLQEPSARELKPAQQGALAMARLIEIAPFDDGNGRVARLAASHLMVRAGARPPVLRGRDRARLDQALQAAFALDTAPLVRLLDEAAERAVDVMIRVLEAEAPSTR